MWKKFLAASAVATGIAGLLAGGDAFAASYTSGQNIPVSGDINVCVSKTGGYTGDAIIADIRGTNYEKQLVFSDASCVAVADIPSDTNLKFIAPMGMGGLEYTSESGAVALSLNSATTVNKYLKISGSMGQRVEAERFTISFYANGGTGRMTPITALVADGSVVLPFNSLTRANYVFRGWNTKADGTGVDYVDGATINLVNSGKLELFAKWEENFATLATGKEVNVRLKRLINDDPDIRFNSRDQVIKTVEFVGELNTQIVSVAQTDIAADGSQPIIAYYDGEGAIYIDTMVDRIYANKDSSYMFSRMRALTTISFPSADSFSTSRVENMTMMFGDNDTHFNASDDNSLTTINGLQYFNTSSLKNMDHMFAHSKIANADSIATTQRDGYRSWNISGVENIGGLFRGVTSLTDISALSSWDVRSIKGMTGAFYGCKVLSDISPLSTWDVSKVKEMRVLFTGAEMLADISPLAEWRLDSITSLEGMFERTRITDLSPIRTTQRDGYKSWDVSNITDMSAVFARNQYLTDISPLSTWDVSKVKKFGNDSGATIGGMFESDINLTDISPLAGWDISSATNLNYMFGCSNSCLDTFNLRMALTDISPLAGWNTSNVTDMRGLFALTSISDLSPIETRQRDGYKSWDVIKVRKMSYTFSGMLNLTNVSPLSSWDINGGDEMDVAVLFGYSMNIDDFSPVENWGVGYNARMNSAFRDIPVSVVRPSWYHE